MAPSQQPSWLRRTATSRGRAGAAAGPNWANAQATVSIVSAIFQAVDQSGDNYVRLGMKSSQGVAGGGTDLVLAVFQRID